ncbi:DDE-type integrase/transposase/recombinase [Flavobacteriales bacterium]|nr:DDE-type integrase/transposase/recombinase [Flavobacteriales bacterium]
MRKCKYLDNIVEQVHRFIKLANSICLGFKGFESAGRTLSGIEIVRMIKKNQLIGHDKSVYKSFMSLAALN